MAATEPPETPFDYFVSLYKWQNTPNAGGGWTEKVVMYLGNVPGGAHTGPGYNIQFTVIDPSGHNVCSEFWHELSGLREGRTYSPYQFTLVYPKPPLMQGHPVILAAQVKYRFRAAVIAEHSDKDTNQTNRAAEQFIAFTGGGGSPTCTRLPRPDFH